MRTLIVGAGAVGTVLHRALEATPGNEATFLLRPGSVAPQRTTLVDASTGAVRVRERPTAITADEARPAVDAVVFAVRADQLAAALDTVGPVDAGVRFAVIAPADAALVRARHPGHAVVRIAAAFFAYTEGGAVHLWVPPLVKTPVLYEDAGGLAFAGELAAALAAGGVPARAKRPAANNPVGDALHVALAGYALAGYDADALARDRATLDLVGGAIGEVPALDGAAGAGALARRAAAGALRATLAGRPLMPKGWRTMWRLHGPKADGQTRAMVEVVAERARKAGQDAPSLRALVARLREVSAPVGQS